MRDQVCDCRVFSIVLWIMLMIISFILVNAFDQATSYCVSTLERGQSLADSAYGTEDQGSLETFSSSDCYSDPFSSGLTPVKNPSSPIKIARDQLNIRK